ncbi:hypothetical protein SORBI_3008G084401 [Sorghum bicolor]|uniref:Uncharacterized protein n=1 Tax=Sorghum bicolor TaxID=4558 RepID=A0A1Z5R5J3_SORBI|nr:hypothetical protein SORBI_3008G084401 [Sorghum bicolor]
MERVLEPFTKYPYLQASQRKIPILIDAERKGAAGAKFPQAWTGASSIPVALVSMLQAVLNLHATTNGSRRLMAVLTLEHRLVSKTPPKFSGSSSCHFAHILMNRDVVWCVFPSFCMDFGMRFKYIILGHYTVTL